ncbi:MAG: DUF4340 domain-containing protein, partial [Candidatus Latescibacteria bacterium]|nr:DUF4340 domain-containing protein [Candidatus Latescibacterota bacterium]
MAESKSRSRTALLAVFALGLGFYAYYGEMERESVETPRDTKDLFDMSYSDIKAAVIVSQNDTLRAERSDQGGWTLIDPVADHANKQAWNSIGTSFSRARRNRDGWRVSTPDSLALFGLLNPTTSVNFELDSLTTRSIYLGRKTTTSNHVYARWEDSTEVFTVGDILLTNTDKPVKDFRSTVLLPEGISASDIQSLSLTRDGEELALTKQDIKWRLLSPSPSMFADADSVMALVNAVNMSPIQAFIDNPMPLARYGLENPKVAMTLTDRNEEDVRLLIGKPAAGGAGRRYMKDAKRPPVLVVSDDVWKNSWRSIESLRNTKAVHFVRKDANVVEWHYGADSTIVAQADSVSMWSLPSHGDVDAHRPIVNTVVAAVDRLLGKDLIVSPRSLKRYGLNSPRLRLLLKNGEDVLVELLVGRKRGETTYVKPVDLPVVYAVESDIVKELFVSLDDLLPPENSFT